MSTAAVRRSDAVVELGGDPARWYRDAVIYELHVRAFRDSDGDGVGDFRGLVQKLDYIHDLGVTAIWLLPFYPSPLRDDGYDIAEYRGVHPMYGQMRDFRTFLREAKRRGLRVITELVMNHTSDEHEWFRRSRHARPGSQWRDFYVWSDTPDRYEDARIIFQDFETSNWAWDAVSNQYYWHRFYAHQPDLNFDSPRVRRAMFDVVDFWLEMGVDGLRLDAVPYLFEREGTSCENLPETLEYLGQLRRHVDERFGDRMLLAEANQWPEDAVAYFGQGDRCHMAFHFPLMPRMFMANRMEDRFPLVDIIQQTPPIPEGSQWATFLRNHDELTLEMVTDEERDYMYRVFAEDPQARINLGIRRRLAPLLANDRRRIEMMNVLLLSLPGTPVVYYGDEIGMGDNIYLGDRDGVRTPMQWTADRNAGFSSANPQRLYLPVIADPEYQPAAINVEAQQGNSHSLLWWTRHAIGIRRHAPAFSRGSLEFLYPDNRKVLAFLRVSPDGEDRVLVVVNLSRTPQFVELDLSRFDGMVPTELFGPTPFPPIGELPYFITLGPYGYYWFRLDPGEPDDGDRSDRPIPIVDVRGRWLDALTGGRRAPLPAALPSYLQRQRWFGAKSRRIVGLDVTDALPIGREGALALLRVTVDEGEPQPYLLPLARRDASGEGRPPDHTVVAVLTDGSRRSVLTDGSWDRDVASQLLGLVAGRRAVRGSAGRIAGTRTERFAELRGEEADLEPHVASAEQSNTSIVFGDRLILKLFRRPGPGTNPDLEISRFLTERGFANTPAVAGALEYDDGRGGSLTLGILQSYVANEGDAWAYTVDQLQASFEEALARPREEDVGARRDGGVLDLAGGTTPEERALVGPFLQAVELLGRRTAEMHLALASAPRDPTFSAERFTELDQRALYQSIRSATSRMLRRLRRRSGEDRIAELIEREPELVERLGRLTAGPIAGMRLRHHGDYHLGQVLYTGRDFVIIDFEGEPARPLSERRIKRPPLRDVAGMLRSFDYAADTALHSEATAALSEDAATRLEPWARQWTRSVGDAFVRSYLATAAGAPFLPRDDEALGRLLDALLLEKAVYEIGYELDHRPSWVTTPVRGILELLDRGPAR